MHLCTVSFPVAYRAQFHKACKHKICLAWNFFLDKNSITNQISTWFSGYSKQQLNTSINQYATNENLVGNPVFTEKFHAKQFFVLSSSMISNNNLISTSLFITSSLHVLLYTHGVVYTMYTAKFIVKTAQTTNRRALSLAPWPLTLKFIVNIQYCSTLYVLHWSSNCGHTLHSTCTVHITNLLRRCFCDCICCYRVLSSTRK